MKSDFEDKPLTIRLGDLFKNQGIVERSPYELGKIAKIKNLSEKECPFGRDTMASNEKRIEWMKGYNSR